MEKILKIAKEIVGLKQSEIDECREVFNGQCDFTSPLKMKTQSDQNKLGEKNNLALDKLIELKGILEKDV